jgi:hypothetical protein
MEIEPADRLAAPAGRNEIRPGAGGRAVRHPPEFLGHVDSFDFEAERARHRLHQHREVAIALPRWKRGIDCDHPAEICHRVLDCVGDPGACALQGHHLASSLPGGPHRNARPWRSGWAARTRSAMEISKVAARIAIGPLISFI